MSIVIPIERPATVRRMPGPGSKSLPPEQIEEVQRHVRELIDGKFNGNISAAAETLEIAYATLYGLYHKVGGAGNVTIQKIADYLKMPLDRIVGRSSNVQNTTTRDARPICGGPRIPCGVGLRNSCVAC